MTKAIDNSKAIKMGDRKPVEEVSVTSWNDANSFVAEIKLHIPVEALTEDELKRMIMPFSLQQIVHLYHDVSVRTFKASKTIDLEAE